MKVNKEQLTSIIDDIISNGAFTGEEVDITTKKVMDAVEPLIIALEVLQELRKENKDV